MSIERKIIADGDRGNPAMTPNNARGEGQPMKPYSTVASSSQ